MLEESIGRLAHETIDRMLAHGGACDFVVRYPLKVIMLILGIPDEHGQHLLDITRAYFGGGDPEMQRGSDLIGATMAYMDFFRGIARERRSRPTNDVATLIATAAVDGSLIGEFLNDEGPIAGGRALCGFPKNLAQPTLRREIDTLVGTLEYGPLLVVAFISSIRSLAQLRKK